jgi:menaquinone-dependent protoporphyrinogen oxidase
LHVLVAYATKHGSTAGIAEAIGQELNGLGFQVDVLPAREVRNLSPYGAVILGSAIYMGRWRGEAVRFGRRHASELDRRPVWLFGSGPRDRSAEETEIPPVEAAAELASAIHARGHVTFGGNWPYDAKHDRYGDFRNFDRIRAWARGVGQELQKDPSG